MTQFGGNPVTAGLAADTGTGRLMHASVTLGNTGVVTTVTLPYEARGFRLSPVTNNVWFAVGEDPVAPAALAFNASQAYTLFTVGGTAVAGQQEVRLLPIGASRTLRLAGASNATVCLVEIF